MTMDAIGWKVNDGVVTLQSAILALFRGVSETPAPRALAVAGRDFPVSRALGPVACADCWTIVDDAPIGTTVLCGACRNEVWGRR